jgi:hypothetical protein
MADYYGSVSWFCCGPAYGGVCPVSTGSSCGDCRNDSLHCAWPKLLRPGYPNCDVSSQCISLPWRYCGNQITVYNQCNGLSISPYIHDCGPNANAYCNTSSCNIPNRPAIVDLTPRTFAYIGNLDVGRYPCRVTA